MTTLIAANAALGLCQQSGLPVCLLIRGAPDAVDILPAIVTIAPCNICAADNWVLQHEACRINAPLVLLVIGINAMTSHRYQQRDLESLALLRPYCKQVMRPTNGCDIVSTMLRAVAIAGCGIRGPVAVEIPSDFLTAWHSVDLISVTSTATHLTAELESNPQPTAPAVASPAMAAVLRCTTTIDSALQVVPSLWCLLGILRHTGSRPTVPLIALSTAQELVAASDELKKVQEQWSTPVALIVQYEPGSQLDMNWVAAAFGSLARVSTVEALAAELTTIVTSGANVPTILSMECELHAPVQQPTGSWLPRVLTQRNIDNIITCGTCLPSGHGCSSVLALNNARAAGLAAVTYWRTHGTIATLIVDNSITSLAQLTVAMVEACLSQSVLFVVVLGCVGHKMQQSWWPACKAVLCATEQEPAIMLITQGAAQCSAGTAGVVVVVVPETMGIAAVDSQANESSVLPAAEQLPPYKNDKVVTAVAEALSGATQPLLVIGAGAAQCQAELIQLAESCGAVVVTTFSGKGIFPEDHPQWLWTGCGAAMPSELQAVAHTSDVALVIGARLSEVATSQYNMQLPQTCFHVDIDSQVPGSNWKAHPILSDASAFMASLIPKIHKVSNTCAASQQLVTAHKQAQLQLQSLSDPSVMMLMSSLRKTLPEGTLITTDAGVPMHLAAEHLRLTSPHCFVAPADSCTTEFALAAAIGAAAVRRNGCPLVVAFTTSTVSLAASHHAAACDTPLLVVLLRDCDQGLTSVDSSTIAVVPQSCSVQSQVNAALAHATANKAVLLDFAVHASALQMSRTMYGHSIANQLQSQITMVPQDTLLVPSSREELRKTP